MSGPLVHLTTSLVVCLLVYASAVPAAFGAGNWPQWRGPTGDGVSTETGLPIAWSETSGVLWKCPLPEWGTSTPAVWGEAIFVTSHIDDRHLVLLKVDKQTGKIEWTRRVGSGSTPTGSTPWGPGDCQTFHKDHNLASPSPVTDGRLVVVHFGNGDLAAYDFQGRRLWGRNLQEDYGRYTIGWGHANSPVLYGDLVISVCIQNPTRGDRPDPAPNYVVAHEKQTGREVWKAVRPNEARRFGCDSYITPIVREVDGRAELIVAGGEVLDAYDPACGRRWWHLPGMAGNEAASCPVAAHGMIYTTQGRRRTLLAVKPGGGGERPHDDVAWSFGHAAWDCPSPVVWGPRIFLVSNSGIARCLDAEAGRLLWTARLRGGYRASPVAAEDRVYFLNMQGLTTVVSASPRDDPLSENQLDDETHASPALSDGKLFIRGRKSLYCLGKQEPVRAGPSG